MKSLRQKKLESSMAPKGRATGGFLPPESMRNDPVNRAIMAEFHKKLEEKYPLEDIKEEYDERDKHYTPVKNQESCGACAAFASAGMMEAVIAKAYEAKFGKDKQKQQFGANLRKLDMSE